MGETVRRNAFNGSTMRVHAMSRSDDWETPPELFAQLDAEFHFTLDVAASFENTKCARFCSTELSGLAADWSRDVCWMNPPYGREIAVWMRKAFEESQRGATVVCLVPARTDTRWWHAYAERATERRFLKGRLRFRRNGELLGTRPASCPFPSAIVVFRAVAPQGDGT